MFKLIIWVSGRPNLEGFKKREFVWNERHKAFIYEGKEFSPEEVNAKYEKAWFNNQDLMPRVRVVDIATVAVEPASAVRSVTVTTPAPSAPITVEQAEEVLQRLAPERLKKKPGRKAATEMVEVE